MSDFVGTSDETICNGLRIESGNGWVTVVIRTSPHSIRLAHSTASGLAARRTRTDVSLSQVVTGRDRDLGPWRGRPGGCGITSDSGPSNDAESRTRSADRAIEIRERRRRVLSSRPGTDCLPGDSLQLLAKDDQLPLIRSGRAW